MGTELLSGCIALIAIILVARFYDRQSHHHDPVNVHHTPRVIFNFTDHDGSPSDFIAKVYPGHLPEVLSPFGMTMVSNSVLRTSKPGIFDIPPGVYTVVVYNLKTRAWKTRVFYVDNDDLVRIENKFEQAKVDEDQHQFIKEAWS